LNELVTPSCGSRLDQARQRLPNRGEGLIQIGWHLREIVARFRLGRKAQGDANLVDALQASSTWARATEKSRDARVKVLPRDPRRF